MSVLRKDYQISGLFPVQAEGHIDGRSLYFRALNKHWTFAISPDGRDPVTIDRPGEGFFRAGAWNPDSDEDPHERAKDLIEHWANEFIWLLDAGLKMESISNSSAVYLDGFYSCQDDLPSIVLGSGASCYFDNLLKLGIPHDAPQRPYRYFGCASVGGKFNSVLLVLTDVGIIHDTASNGYVDYVTWRDENQRIGPGGIRPMGREAPS